MKNTLKFVLLIVGTGLVAYGVYSLFFLQPQNKTLGYELIAEYDQTQAIAMIGLGVLALLSGIAFRKR